MRRGGPFALALAALAIGAAVQAVPDTAAADAALAKATAARGGGDLRGAEYHLQAALKAGASRQTVAVAMGQVLLAQGRAAEARTWLAPGQFARGEELSGWRSLAAAEQALGNLPAAGRAFDRALALAPRNAGLWVEIGRLRYAGGEQWQALGAAEYALQLDPENVAALAFRGELERDRAGPQAALTYFEQALERSPKDQSLRLGQAATLGELGRYEAMLSLLRDGRADDGRALFLQAVMAARAQDYRLARSLRARAAQRWPRSAAALELEAILELEEGNANEAVLLLDRLIARQPVNYRVRLLLARALYDSGQQAVLLDRFANVAARGDAPVYLLTLMGRAAEDLGDRATAARWLDRAAARRQPEVTPLPYPGEVGWQGRWMGAQGSVGVGVPLVRSLLASGNMAQAETVAEAARRAHTGSADAQWLAGDAQLALGRHDAALDRYVAASQIRYADLLILRMSQALEQQGRPDEAGAATARYLAAYPGSRLAARLAANQRALAGDWAASAVLLESLVERGGGRDARLLADLSLAKLRAGDKAGALDSARRAWLLQPASPVGAQALGMALAATGRNAEARALLEQARATGGDNLLLAETRKTIGA